MHSRKTIAINVLFMSAIANWCKLIKREYPVSGCVLRMQFSWLTNRWKRRMRVRCHNNQPKDSKENAQNGRKMGNEKWKMGNGKWVTGNGRIGRLTPAKWRTLTVRCGCYWNFSSVCCRLGDRAKVEEQNGGEAAARPLSMQQIAARTTRLARTPTACRTSRTSGTSTIKWPQLKCSDRCSRNFEMRKWPVEFSWSQAKVAKLKLQVHKVLGWIIISHILRYAPCNCSLSDKKKCKRNPFQHMYMLALN